MKNSRIDLLGEKFFTSFFFVVGFTSIASVISNYLLGVTHILNYVGIIFFIWAVIAIALKKAKICMLPFFIAVAAVYCPSVYIITDGFCGSNPLFLVPIAFMTALLFEKRIAIIISSFVCAEYIALSILQLSNSDFFVPYPSDQDRMIAMCISIVLCFLGVTALTGTYLKIFVQKDEQNKQLLDELTLKNEELKNLSLKDALTGAFNRRYLMSVFDEEIAYCYKNEDHLSFLLLDIDFFKKANDTHGHAFGDSVLKDLVITLLRELRNTDILVRYGGEEFAILLPSTNKELAIAVAERLRKAIEQIKNRKNHRITVSIGVSTLIHEEKNDCADDIIERADKNLYRAKKEGRNQVCSL